MTRLEDSVVKGTTSRKVKEIKSNEQMRAIVQKMPSVMLLVTALLKGPLVNVFII